MIPMYQKFSRSIWMYVLFHWCVLLCINVGLIVAYNQVDEASYLSNFGQIIANSYSHPLPSQLLASTCKTNVGISGVTRTLGGGTISATQAQSICGIDSTCIIPAGTTLLMDNSLVVGALINRGTIQWTSSTQSQQHQWLCAGYIATEGGTFTLDLSNNGKYAYIYIKNNGATHPILHSRAFGGSDGARIRILGSPLPRTWSLLSRPVNMGSSTITLMHDVASMGWKVGDRIIIAPTTVLSTGKAESYRIAGINANTITLGQLTSSATATTQQSFQSNTSYVDSASAWSTIMAAEVIHMSRNIIITGDDFQHRPCRSDITSPAEDCMCMPNMGRTQCTLGLHTILVGTGGLLHLQYTRVEKCGQRGILGKYCVHTHLSSQCPDCIIRGNSIEYGHQRGIVIHGTHLSTVEQNVMNDIRGANIYIEDGNEMYNRILYNIALCPWPLSDPYLQGCTIPGTDNDQSDTTINQAGIWALSFSNDIIGNRMINSYNGMLYQAQGYEKGRDETQGQICPNNQQIGRLEGNTFHGHGRFGTYVLSSIYPKAVTTVRTLNNNGLLPNNDFSACAAATPDGTDRGIMVSFYRNIDYGNTFVGQYNMGDIQYVDHTSIECNNLIYWKETKNPADGCSSYYLNGYFEGSPSVPGNLALPSGHGTVVLENIVLAGTITMESSHHCQEGWTGVLCMPTYVFHKVRAPVKDVKIQYSFGKNNGAMYTLSPDDPTNAGGNLFPIGYISLANPFWSYLLALDGGRTCFTSSSVASSLGEDVNAFTTRFARGILCKRPLRRLEIWTPTLTTSMNPPNLRLELIQNNVMISYVIIPFFQISGGELGKQGYAITVIPGTTHQYRLMREDKGPIDNNWVIEFSDTIFGNRWARDEILLTVVGRSCPSPVHSLHDRRFIWYDSDNHPFQAGRGACTSQPDMPVKNCQTVPSPPIGTTCPEKCPGGCNNGYCDCGRGVCQCNAGYYGPNCAQDVCASSFVCNPTYGRCTARYLGGTLPPVENMCACKQNIFGPYCDIDPCAGQTCSGHGKCTVLTQTSIACICDAGWNGGTCSLPCSGSSCEPACLNGFQHYQDSNLETNIYDRQFSPDAATCAQQCAADGNKCMAALFYNGNYCGKLSRISGPRTSFPGRIFLMRCSQASLPPPAATDGTNTDTNVVITTPAPVIATPAPVITTQAPVVSTTTAPVPATTPPVTITNPPPSSSTTATASFNAYGSSYTVSGVINGDTVTLSLSCADTSVRLTSVVFMVAFSNVAPLTDISQLGCTTTGAASTLSCSMPYKPLPLYMYVMWNVQGVSYRMQHPLPQPGVSPFLPAFQFSTTTTVATTPPTQAPVPVTQAPVVSTTTAPVPATTPPVTITNPPPSTSTTATTSFNAYGSSYTVSGEINGDTVILSLSCADTSVRLTSVVFMVAFSNVVPLTDISQLGCTTTGSASTLSCSMPYKPLPLYMYVMWNVQGVSYRMQHPLPQPGVSPFLPAFQFSTTATVATTPPTPAPTQAVPVTQAPVPVTQAPVPVTQSPPPSTSSTVSVPFTAYSSSYTLTGSVNSACTSVTLSLTSSTSTLTSVIFMVAYSTTVPMTDISQPGCSTTGSSSTLSCLVTLPYQRIPLYIYVMWNAVGVPYRMQQPLPQAGVSPFLPGMNLVCTGGAAGTQDDDIDLDEDTPTIPPPITDSGICRDCSMIESGWDYMGMDLARKPVPANLHTECCSICSATRGCHAYSYYNGYCYLKSTSAGRVRRIGATSSTLCTAKEQIGYQDASVTYDVTIASCIDDDTCEKIHGKLSQCIRPGAKGATGYCHCRKDAVISGSGQCIRASKCGTCPGIPDCSEGRYAVLKKAAAPDQGRCCHQYKCVRMGGQGAAGIQTPAEEVFEDESIVTTEAGTSRMKSMMITIGVIVSVIVLLVIAASIWSYRKHQSPFSFKFQLHRDQHEEREGTVPITHLTADTSSNEYAQGAISPSPVHHFSLSSLTTSTSNSSISDSFVPASPATLWNMARLQRSDSTDVSSDSNLTSIPEFPQGHFSISRRHQYSRAPSPEPNPATNSTADQSPSPSQ